MPETLLSMNVLFGMDHVREHVERNLAATIADLDAMGNELQRLAPDPSRDAFPVADGRAVFLGRGLFVNRVLGLGLKEVPLDAELDRFESKSRSLGHVPAVDVSNHAVDELDAMLQERNYVADGINAVMTRDPAGSTESPNHDVEIVTAATLEQWCEATARGWGHTTEERRAPSDLYGRAAFAVQDPGLLLARSIDDGRIVGCAALAIIGETAIFGGMSTLPSERQSGVQASLIDARLRLAAESGCSLATTQAEIGGGSQRNLARRGFTQVDTVTTWIFVGDESA